MEDTILKREEINFCWRRGENEGKRGRRECLGKREGESRKSEII
jgi:hypothetical protein